MASARSPVVLFAGPQELLVRRAADRYLQQLRADSGGALDVIDVRAPDLKDAGLPDLRTASLFGDPRALVVREAQELPTEVGAALLQALAAPATLEAAVVLLATGTGRIQALAKRLKEAGARYDVSPPRDWDDRAWSQLVRDEFRIGGRAADDDAVTAILAHAGFDVANIAEKVAQACTAAPPGRVTAATVEDVVVGHGSRGTFAVADAMCDRDPGGALVLLRGALEAGEDPVLVLGALAYRLRSLVAVAGKLDPKAAGLSITPGQARRLQGVRRGFGAGELTAAYRTLADADRELKGGELPPRFVIERAVVAVATRG